MSFKCPDCGATIKDDSRFCNYCGAKIDDGVQRSEINVNINKRVEDVAEVKRAGYEEKESNARVKQMERAHKGNKAKRITLVVVFVVFALLTIPTFTKIGGNDLFVLGIFAFFIAAGTGIGILYQMITGKW